MSDWIVRVWVPLDVRVEGMDDAGQAESVATDYMHLQDPLTGKPALDGLMDGMEPTVFYVKPDGIRYEPKLATD